MTELAFPSPDWYGNWVGPDANHGMTLRDWFAGQAPAPSKEFRDNYRSAIPAPALRYTYGHADDDKSRRKYDSMMQSQYEAAMIAAWSYRYADAMLAARSAK